MRILVVSQWFPPEPGGGPARFLETGREWASAGHDVTVVAGMPNWPTGVTAPGYDGKVHVAERMEGIDVHRTWVFPTPNEGRWKRAGNHLSFVPSAMLTTAVARIPADVVVATSPPLFAPVAGLAIARARRVPFVFDVRDLWPDAIFTLGQLGNPTARSALRRLERTLYRASDAVVVVSGGFVDHVVSHGARRVEVVTNGADLELFRPGPADVGLRKELGWDDRFVILYAGTLGMAHGLLDVVRAAESTRDRRCLFVLMGDGAERDVLLRSVNAKRLDNVQILPLQPRNRMPDFYRSADACLVSLRPLPLFDAFIPSKIFEIMACGRPILAAVRGESLRIVMEAGAGLPVTQEDPSGLSGQASELAASPADRIEAMGRSGRKWAEANVDRSQLAARYLSVLHDVLRDS